MSLRIIVRCDGAGMAVNVGGSVFTEFATFVVEAPEVEAWLNLPVSVGHRQIVGVEVVPSSALEAEKTTHQEPEHER